jgi:alkylhydroperoxidase family enzyme
VSQIGDYATSELFTEREKMALRYADAITWDPTQAHDALWATLKRHFLEAELVELGFLIGVLCGGQSWIHALGVRHGDVQAESQTYRPELAEQRQ